MIGWCFVCERENVELRQYRQHDGTLALACADERACCDAHASKPRRRGRGRRPQR